MMYKRPSKRVKVHPVPTPVRGTLPPGSFLGSIINNESPNFYERVKEPVYQQEIYLRALKKNYEDNGLSFKDPELPEYVQPERPQPTKEPELIYGDRVQVTFRVLKNGVVRVKVNAAIADVYDKYYRRGKKPPFKTILQAYKSHGFSKEFLEKIKMRYEKQKLLQPKLKKFLKKYSTKNPSKNPKKKRRNLSKKRRSNFQRSKRKRRMRYLKTREDWIWSWKLTRKLWRKKSIFRNLKPK